MDGDRGWQKKREPIGFHFLVDTRLKIAVHLDRTCGEETRRFANGVHVRRPAGLTGRCMYVKIKNKIKSKLKLK